MPHDYAVGMGIPQMSTKCSHRLTGRNMALSSGNRCAVAVLLMPGNACSEAAGDACRPLSGPKLPSGGVKARWAPENANAWLARPCSATGPSQSGTQHYTARSPSFSMNDGLQFCGLLLRKQNASNACERASTGAKSHGVFAY